MKDALYLAMREHQATKTKFNLQTFLTANHFDYNFTVPLELVTHKEIDLTLDEQLGYLVSEIKRDYILYKVFFPFGADPAEDFPLRKTGVADVFEYMHLQYWKSRVGPDFALVEEKPNGNRISMRRRLQVPTQEDAFTLAEYEAIIKPKVPTAEYIEKLFKSA